MQSRISSFFATDAPSSKRAAVPVEERASQTKRQKVSPTPAVKSSLKNEAVSDIPQDVQSRIRANRAAALARLAARKANKTPGSTVNGFPALERSWRSAVSVTIEEPFWAQLASFVQSRRQATTVYPPPELIFSAFNYSPFFKTKVVIIGQDPYHGPRQAHGMCFSVARGQAIPPSLRNMYKELTTDVSGFSAPKHGNLEEWAKQGVLLLNNVLTVEAGKPNSHKGRGWERFTDSVVSAINKREGTGCVFLLWGSFAKSKCKSIDLRKHKVLSCPHPSPLSADRGFFGCHHFSKTNEYLKSSGQEPINWTLSD